MVMLVIGAGRERGVRERIIILFSYRI